MVARVPNDVSGDTILQVVLEHVGWAVNRVLAVVQSSSYLSLLSFCYQGVSEKDEIAVRFMHVR